MGTTSSQTSHKGYYDPGEHSNDEGSDDNINIYDSGSGSGSSKNNTKKKKKKTKAIHKQMERDSGNYATNRRRSGRNSSVGGDGSRQSRNRSSRDHSDRATDSDRGEDRYYQRRGDREVDPDRQGSWRRNGSASPLHGTDSRSMSPPNDHASYRGRSNAHVADDNVNTDLPMADLMAYLQVVANNSSNLPLTRRDDPDLGRTVSSLTADEYATKCKAFIPSDVRILGGQFARYGRVWDLPTVEEFDVVSSTREPGLSHGGACCNALLKAMYDTESEANNVTQGHLDHKNLFDDDDDETVETSGFTVDRTIGSFDTLVMNDGTAANSMTWAELLRKMQAEMQGVGFHQYPALTSSYKFDLDTPFSLVPPNFQKNLHKKRALLIGCNYRNLPDGQLKACHDDVRSMKDFLVNVYGFPESPDVMTVLLDDRQHKPPTHQNIVEAFKQLAEKSQPGDAVFVLFTGHGCRALDSRVDSESESYDEVILPLDFERKGVIRDTLLFKTFFAPMKKGVLVTCIIDACHTGVMMDLPYLWTTKADKGDAAPKMSLNNDFSFVRFLKVVKTLYESSVFTKLGKTVGSELDKQLPARDDETEDGSLVTMGENESLTNANIPKSSLLQFFACPNPKDLATKVINCTLNAPFEYSDDDTIPQVNTMDDHDDDDETFGTGTSNDR